MEKVNALKILRELHNKALFSERTALETFVPELKESKEEKTERILHSISSKMSLHLRDIFTEEEFQCFDTWSNVWLEKQGSEPNWCHHKVDLSNCSEEYRKAYYDGWNNCNQQHSQCKSERNDVVKCLINGMKFYYEDNEEATWGTEKFSMKVKDILSWLEKQGEHAKFRDSMQVGDKVTRNEDGVLVNLSQLNRVAKDEKQVEQKPAEWSKDNLPEFESYLCLMFQKFRTKGICTNGEIIDFVMEHAQKLKDTLYHAWNEEDESMYVRTLGVLGKCYIGELPIEVEEELKWLKSLKDRVQPKQEWSEEEIETCAREAEDNNCIILAKHIRQLKSLRPQSTWKPSDEQIVALKHASNDCSIAFADMKILATLYEQLKALHRYEQDT